MAFFVYILYSDKSDRFYIGQTNSISARIKKHNSGQVQSTAPYAPWKLVLTISKEARAESLLLERKLKNLNRDRLQEFIEKYG